MTLETFLQNKATKTGIDQRLSRLSDTERKQMEALFDKAEPRGQFLSMRNLSEKEHKLMKRLLNKVSVTASISWKG